MTKVFFSGSRRFTRLSQAVRERADNIVARGFTVLIGDASGADTLMQDYLARKGYRKVIVFCTGRACRNNVGHWETRQVEPSAPVRSGFGYYAVKDAKMSEEATYGFMMWDGKSKGTLNNIFNLLNQNKKALVYFAPTDTLRQVGRREDLASLLATAGGQTLEELETELHVKIRPAAREKQLTLT